MAGGAVIGAGNLVIEQGRLLSLKPHSGHYMPTLLEFFNLIDLMKS